MLCIHCIDPLVNLILDEVDCGVNSFSISWSSPAQSVCKAISYHLTLFVTLDDGRYEMLDTFTNITITHYNFTGLTSSTSYLFEVIPIYNGLVGYSSNIIVTTKDQPSTTIICKYVCSSVHVYMQNVSIKYVLKLQYIQFLVNVYYCNLLIVYSMYICKL